ncbi:MAG: TonB-dependent receptor [Candidatus Eisenbacteria bacterium]
MSRRLSYPAVTARHSQCTSGRVLPGLRRVLGPIGLALLVAAAWPTFASAADLMIRTLNAETGKPVSDVTVRIVEPSRLEFSDHRGHATFPGLPPGRYKVFAQHVSYLPADTVEVTLSDVAPGSGTPRPFDLQLKPTAWVVDQVVITGTRSPHLLKNVPVQTELVTKKDFVRTGASTVDEALAWAVGINVREDLSGQGASLRGIDGDRVLVLVDGERAVGRVRGSIDLSQLSLTQVDRIEVVKGTGSTLYGSDAMGGVINIITRDPEKSGPKLRLSGDYGTFQSMRSTADFSFPRTKRFSWDLGGQYYRTDGFDLDESTPHTNGQEAIDRLNLESKWSYRLAPKWRLKTSLRFMDEGRDWLESELRGGTTFVFDDTESNQRYEGSTTMEYKSGDEYEMSLRLFGTFYDHRWEKFTRTGTLADSSDTEDTFLEAAYYSNYVIGDSHVATYGFDATYQDLSSTEISTGKEATKSWDGYFQYEYSPTDAFNFLPGVRYEHSSSFGDHVNPSLNIMYVPALKNVAPHLDLKLRGFVGRGYRAPSIKQQYFVFDHTAAGYIVYGGSVDVPEEIARGRTFGELDAETSINSSLSAEFSYGATGRHRLTYFYNHLDNLIDFVLVDLTNPTYWRGIYVYQNVDRAFTRGIEWESKIRVTPDFEVQFSYDWLSSRDLGTGQVLLGRPEHTGKVVLSYNHPSGWSGSVWGEGQTKKLWTSLSNTGEQEEEPEWAPARSTWNLSMNRTFTNGLSAYLRMENLFDETNVTYGYWPGFQTTVGVGYQKSFD